MSLGWGQVQRPGEASGAQNPGQSVLSVRPDYQLGPNDQILITVPQAPEINQRPFRVDAEGFIELPLVGKVHAAGLTVRALEGQLTGKLREFIREPQLSIMVTQFRSEPVFFLGSFKAPGIYALQGNHTLVEMLALVGGLQPNASHRIKITRRGEYGTIALPGAVKDTLGRSSTVEISLQSLTQNVNPVEDITLQAYDVVSAAPAAPIYLTGEFVKPGTILPSEQQSLSITQAISQGGGLTPAATRGKVRILRPILGTSRRAEIEVNLGRVYAGKDNDFPLLPNDVVYAPRANLRTIFAPVGTSLLTTAPLLIVSLAVAGVF